MSFYWHLKKYQANNIGLLAGFMLGSMNELWPWKLVLSYRTSSSGEQKPFLTENISPTAFLEQTGVEPQIFLAVIAFLVGIGLVVGIERLANYLQKS
jgi:putative membrane protein